MGGGGDGGCVNSGVVVGGVAGGLDGVVAVVGWWSWVVFVGCWWGSGWLGWGGGGLGW